MLLELALFALAIVLAVYFQALVAVVLTIAVFALAAYAVFWLFGLFVPTWLLLVLGFVTGVCLFRSAGRG